MNCTNKYKYIIYSPIFKEDSGGTLALHNLCHQLNQINYPAFIYFKPNYYRTIKLAVLAFLAYFNFNGKHFLNFRFFRNTLSDAVKCSFFAKFKPFNTPVFSGEINKNHIVIYPEITDGNPLNATNIVRWFLHKPGFHTGEINFGKNELYFFFQESFNDENLNQNKDNLLRLIHLRDDIFYDKKIKNREGTCYAIRKGKGKPMVHDMNSSVLIDNLSLKQIGELFNRCEYFISYDTKTGYSRYAVMCGCKSIVIPDEGISKEEWQPEENLRYGIAYGLDDLAFAEKTKDLLIANMRKMQEDNETMVRRFVEKCSQFFKD